MSDNETALRVDVDALAQEIRRVDGSHSLGAGALAEALAPYIAARASDGAQGEMTKLLATALLRIAESSQAINDAALRRWAREALDAAALAADQSKE